MTKKQHIRSHIYLEPNLYRVTLRHQNGKISAHESRAESMFLAVRGNDRQSQVVSVERIDLSTGEVLGGFYTE